MKIQVKGHMDQQFLKALMIKVWPNRKISQNKCLSSILLVTANYNEIFLKLTKRFDHNDD